MTPKDNIIKTVPLSAIRKVIELDAQDARELRAVAGEMLSVLERLVDILGNEGLYTFGPKVNAYEAAKTVIEKAKAILWTSSPANATGN